MYIILKVLHDAWEDAKEPRHMYMERLAVIRQQRQEAFVLKKEQKELKKQRGRAKKNELTQKLQDIGGL